MSCAVRSLLPAASKRGRAGKPVAAAAPPPADDSADVIVVAPGVYAMCLRALCSEALIHGIALWNRVCIMLIPSHDAMRLYLVSS